MMVQDIFPGSMGSDPFDLTNVNGTVFFNANDGVHGSELWESNGTAAGTVMVRDIAPGNTGSNPEYLINLNGILLFTANDGIHGPELWRSNGTLTGTAPWTRHRFQPLSILRGGLDHLLQR